MIRDPDEAGDTLLMAGAPPASQTLLRGLDVLEQVAAAPMGLGPLASRLGLSRSTVHRLATTLVDRRYLSAAPRGVYGLGPKLLQLGVQAREQISLVRLARPFLEALAAETGDMVVLAVRDGAAALILDQAPGRRRLVPSLRPGDRIALRGQTDGQSSLAKALAPDLVGRHDGDQPSDMPEAGEFRIVAAPVRDAEGAVKAAVSVAAAAVYLDNGDAARLAVLVMRCADHISAEFGWPGLPGASGALLQAAERDLLPMPSVVRSARGAQASPHDGKGCA